ncbi:hypothetical protein [Clostridium weizhouense]|uniref:Uncharacterized protein n=1 Tax=Clostridium weizhouense TaxID=2859781 RepID=A0ABS7AMP5_9CLOT|nr:hypothetical protein [Clostridium weizhouense]MBW6409917.1 hypothetical protein [Clostridium weizhouense]
MRVNYKKTFDIGKNIKIKIAKDSGITFITKYKENHISINKKGIRIYGENGIIKKQKQLWLFKKKKINIKEFKKLNLEKKIRTKNKKSIINEILLYDKNIKNGVKKYKIFKMNFWLMIIFLVIFRSMLMLVITGSILATYFSMMTFKFIKYKKIDSIIKQVAKELAFTNLYNEEKIIFLISQFKKEYGEESNEYKELKLLFSKFENTGKKIEKELNNLEIEDISYYLKKRNKESDINIIKEINNENEKDYNKLEFFTSKNKIDNRTINYTSSFDNNEVNNLAILYRKEETKSDGIKSINRAIEFFDDIDGKEKKERAIISTDNDKLTVYFYKKSSVL